MEFPWLGVQDLDEYMVTSNFTQYKNIREVTGAVRDHLAELTKMPDSKNIKVPWFLSLPRDCPSHLVKSPQPLLQTFPIVGLIRNINTTNFLGGEFTLRFYTYFSLA